MINYGGPGAATSLFMRGANSNQVKIIVDDIAINTASGDSSLRFLSLSEIERIEILRGPASSLYGADAIGGVINIITRRGQPGLRADGFIGYGSRDTQQINAGISGGDEHWRFRVEGNHYQTDGFSAQRHARNKDADDDGYRNTGGAVSLSFLPAQGHELGVSYRENEGLVNYDSGNPLPGSDYDFRERFRVEQWRIFSKNRFHEKWLSTLQYGFAEDYRKRYDAWEISKTRTRNQQFSWQNDMTLPLGHALMAVENQRQEIGPRYDSTGADNYSGNPTHISNTAFLAGWTAHLSRHGWQLNTRRDKHSEFGGKTTYSVAYGYQISDTLRTHVGYGTSFRAPTIVDLFRPGWGGNPDLKPEEAKNSEVALAWEQGAHQASATYYHNKVKNLIVGNPANFWNLDNINKALLEGITLAYRGRFGDWGFFTTYDWLNAKNQSGNADGKRLPYRARHKVTLGLSYTQGKIETGMEVIGMGRRYSDTMNNDALGAYALVNLTTRYALTRALSLEGRLDNLFDKKYETIRGYNTPGFTAFAGLRYSPR
jgi:vitamin B12 transporter